MIASMVSAVKRLLRFFTNNRGGFLPAFSWWSNRLNTGLTHLPVEVFGAFGDDAPLGCRCSTCWFFVAEDNPDDDRRYRGDIPVIKGACLYFNPLILTDVSTGGTCPYADRKDMFYLFIDDTIPHPNDDNQLEPYEGPVV